MPRGTMRLKKVEGGAKRCQDVRCPRGAMKCQEVSRGDVRCQKMHLIEDPGSLQDSGSKLMKGYTRYFETTITETLHENSS